MMTTLELHFFVCPLVCYCRYIHWMAITVVILSVRGRLVRKFMLAAHDLGMTRGDYIFLDVEIFQVSIPF